jgi:hypothetical protein
MIAAWLGRKHAHQAEQLVPHRGVSQVPAEGAANGPASSGALATAANAPRLGETS